jgi:spore germination protein YaaH
MRHILWSFVLAVLCVSLLCFSNARAADDEVQSGFQSIHQQQAEEFSSLVLEAPSVPLADRAPAKTLSAVTPEVSKMVFGYHPYWCDGKEDTYRYYWLTHVAYFSVGVNPSDGSLDTTPGGGATHWATRASNLISFAHANGVKVVLVATLFGTSDVSTFLSNSTARSNAVTNLLNEVVTYGVDGVDIDFEFIASSAGANFTTFMTALATAFHTQNPNYHVSFAGPAGTGTIDNLELGNLNSVCDSVFPMCYNYHYGGSSKTGPVAPLHGSTFWGSSGIAATIDYYVTHGFDHDKVIVGMPNYGIEWPCDSLDRKANTTGSGSATFYYNSHYDVETGAHTRLYDSDSDSPWWAYGTSPNYYQNWYDDHESLQTKINWAATAYSGSLGGVGFWALGYDCPNTSGDVYPKIWQGVGEELTDPHIRSTILRSWICCGAIRTSAVLPQVIRTATRPSHARPTIPPLAIAIIPPSFITILSRQTDSFAKFTIQATRIPISKHLWEEASSTVTPRWQSGCAAMAVAISSISACVTMTANLNGATQLS